MLFQQLVVIFFGILLFTLDVKGQTIPFKHFTSENYLPSNEVYQIREDKDGFIWICTDRGVLRFDGENFKHFSTLDGLISNTVFDVFCDDKGRTWFFTLENGLCYHYKHKIYQHPLSEQLKKQLGKYSKLPYLVVDKEGGIWIGSQNCSEWKDNKFYYISPSEDSLQTITIDTSFVQNQSNLTASQWFVLSDHEHKLLIGAQHHRGHITGSKRPREFNYQRQKNVIYVGERGSYELLRLSTGNWLFFGTNNLIVFDPKKERVLKTIYPNSDADFTIIKINEDHEHNLWLSTTKGIYYYQNGDLNQTPQILFRAYFVTSTHVTKNGALWFSTHKNGVFGVTNRAVHNFLSNPHHPSPETTFVRLFKRKQQPYGLTQNGLIYQLSAIPQKVAKTYSDYMVDLVSLNEEQFLCSDGSILNKEDFSIANIASTVHVGRSVLKSMHRDNRGKIWFATSSGLSFWEGDSLKKSPVNMRTYAIESYGDKLLLGTQEGFFVYDPLQDSMEFLGEKHQVLQERGNAIEQLGKRHFLLGTLGAGLVLLDDSLRFLQQYTPKDGLVSVFIKNIYTENDSTIWIGSNNGCNRIVFNPDFSIKKINTLTSRNVLPASNVNGVLVDSMRIWIATANGLASLPNKMYLDAQSSTIPKAYLVSSKVNGEVFTEEKSCFKHFQNHLEFEFASIYFGHENFQYCYRLVGVDTNWTLTSKRRIHYANLGPGNYEFQVGVKLENGNIGSKRSSIAFTIQPHYTQTYWFRLLCIGLVLLFIFFWGWMYWKQNNLEKLKIQAEQKALHSQIKPHFIFNAMNSILYFIEQNNKTLATLYLSSFSKLLRKILENSQRDLVLITKEMSAIEEYLKLEKFRMEEQKTGYEHYFDIAPIPTNALRCKIPPMLLQTLVENAILHGLATKKGDRILEIRVTVDKDILEIAIIDNGIGRAASKQINARRLHHESTGIKNTELRLHTLSQLYKKDFSLQIIDLEEGTKVVLTIPVLL